LKTAATHRPATSREEAVSPRHKAGETGSQTGVPLFLQAGQGQEPQVQAAQAAGLPSGCGLQARLSIGAVDDPFEREADAVADQVMHTADASGPEGAKSPAVALQRRPGQAQEQLVQTDAEQPGGSRSTDGKFESKVNAMAGNGAALPTATRAWLESRMGSDFSGVRVHHGAAAEALNGAIAARAFTVGSDIFFGPGQYRPESGQGRHLLAHELTHVMQQTGAHGPLRSGPALSVRRRVQRDALRNELDKELADWAGKANKTIDPKNKDYAYDLQEYAWTLINNPDPAEYGPLPEPKGKKARKLWEKKFRKAALLAEMILAGGPAVDDKEIRAGMILNFLAQAGFSSEAVTLAGSMTEKEQIEVVYSGVLDRGSKASPAVLSTITQFFITEKGQTDNPILEKFTTSTGDFEKSLSNEQMTAILKPLIAAYEKEEFLIDLVSEALLRKKDYRKAFSDWMWKEGKGDFLFQVLESDYFIEPDYGPTVVPDVGELKLEGDMDWVYANKQKYYVGYLVQLGKDAGVKIDPPKNMKFATIKTWLDGNTGSIGEALAKKYPDEPDRWTKVYEQLADIFFYHVSGRNINPDLGGKLGKLKAGAPAKTRLRADCDVFSTYAMRFFATVRDPTNPALKAFEPVGYMALDPTGNEGHSVALMRRDGSYYVINNKEVTALSITETKKDDQKEKAIKGMRDDALQVYDTAPAEYKVYYADALATGAMPRALANIDPSTRREDLEP
jgi:hypothetical protein